MTDVNVKYASHNGTTFNFAASQESNVKTVLNELSPGRPLRIQEWNDKISQVQFLERCHQQPDANSVYIPDCEVDDIRKILQSKDVQAAKVYINNILVRLSADVANAKDEVDEVDELKQKYLEDFKTDLAQNSVDEIKQEELRKWVKDCNRELLDNILAYLKDKEGLEAAGLSTKRKKVVELVFNLDDKDMAALLRINYINVAPCHNDISNTKKEYEDARETLNDKKEAYADAKQNLKDRQGYSSDLSEMHFVDSDIESKQMLEASRRASNLARAKRKMQSIKRQGLVSVSRGFAMAAIEGKEEAYMATVVEVGNKVIAATKGAIAAHPAQGIDAQSEEQCNAVLATVKSLASDEIKIYSGEKRTEVGTNAAAQSLAVKNKISNKSKQTQGNGFGGNK